MPHWAFTEDTPAEPEFKEAMSALETYKLKDPSEKGTKCTLL
jgi:hypothetical protein